MNRNVNRRDFLQGASAAAVGLSLPSTRLMAVPLSPSAPVAVAKCDTYGPAVAASLERMFDQIGGLKKLVYGKTVAIKVNVTGSSSTRYNGMDQGVTYWVHPDVVSATVHLIGKAGARRIRIVESPTSSMAPTLEQFLTEAGWKISDLTRAATGVEFENTNFPGKSGKYTRLWVPGGGLIFRAYDVNSAYQDCDIFVSVAKLKEHSTAGVTMAMKNLFGVPPTNIYGQNAGIDEPSKQPGGGRSMLHMGDRQPSRSALAEINPSTPRDPGYRVTRVTADLVAARPIHLSVIDGIDTVAGGEGPWVKGMRPVHAGLLIAGMNPVTTDAVCTALMGFDPMAERGTAPFEKCDSTLKLAEQLGIGTRDLSRIELIGLPISKGKVDFRKVPQPA
jgi:uncharacterized protein (DUF362 family)